MYGHLLQKSSIIKHLTTAYPQACGLLMYNKLKDLKFTYTHFKVIKSYLL